MFGALRGMFFGCIDSSIPLLSRLCVKHETGCAMKQSIFTRVASCWKKKCAFTRARLLCAMCSSMPFSNDDRFPHDIVLRWSLESIILRSLCEHAIEISPSRAKQHERNFPATSRPPFPHGVVYALRVVCVAPSEIHGYALSPDPSVQWHPMVRSHVHRSYLRCFRADHSRLS